MWAARAKVNWKVAGRMAIAWVVTLPAAAVVGAVMWFIGNLFGGLVGSLVIFGILLASSGWMYLHSRKSAVDHSNVNDDWVDELAAAREPVAQLSKVGQ